MADLTKAQLKAQVKDLSGRVFQLKADFKAEQKARISLQARLEAARNSVRTVEVEKPVERVVRKGRVEDEAEIARLNALVAKMEREANAK